MKKPRILVIADVAGSGQYYHAGDEAMAEVAFQRLAKIVGREQLVLACPHPRTAGPAFCVKAIAMPLYTPKTWALHLLLNPVVTGYRILRCLWYLSRVDFVFKAGGGNIRGKYSKFPLLTVARRWRKRIIIVSQTLGPLHGNHRQVLRRQLEDALWIGVRDRSYYAGQTGLPVHFALDDAVYLQPRHNDLTLALAQEYSALVGISFSGCKSADEQQLNCLYRTIEKLVAELEATAVFIPHHAPQNRGDCAAARAVVQHWHNTPFILLEQVPPASAILALTGALRLVISNRYHGVIFGLTMGVPTVALYHDEYTEAKMRGAFEQFQLEPLAFSITNSFAADLTELVHKALARQRDFAAAAKTIPAAGLADNIAPYNLIKDFIAAQSN